MGRIFKNGWFERFARKEKLTDAALREAVRRAESGLIDADLGGADLAMLKHAVAEALRWNDQELDRLVASGTLVEIEDEHEG